MRILLQTYQSMKLIQVIVDMHCSQMRNVVQARATKVVDGHNIR